VRVLLPRLLRRRLGNRLEGLWARARGADAGALVVLAAVAVAVVGAQPSTVPSLIAFYVCVCVYVRV
jgi:hypothetical protein